MDLGSAAVRIASDVNGISGVIELSDGTIVFGEVYEDRLVFLTPDRDSVRYVGREGGGPGEFIRIAAVLKLRADTIAVLDVMSRRLSLFDVQGDFVRAIPLFAGPDGSVWLDCTFYSDSAGHVYAVPTADRSRLRTTNPFDTLPVLQLSTDRAFSKPVWMIEARAPQWFPMANGRVRTRMPLTPPVVVGVAESGTILATTADGRRLISRSVDGLVTTGPLFGLPERDVTKAERDSVTAWYTTKAPYAGTRLDFPVKRAAFDHGVVSPQGETWLRSVEPIRKRSTYFLVDSSGRIKSRVLVPWGSKIVGFGAKALFLVTTSGEGGWDVHMLPLTGLSSPTTESPPPFR